jgi:hypothetical protein
VKRLPTYALVLALSAAAACLSLCALASSVAAAEMPCHESAPNCVSMGSGSWTVPQNLALELLVLLAVLLPAAIAAFALPKLQALRLAPVPVFAGLSVSPLRRLPVAPRAP